MCIRPDELELTLRLGAWGSSSLDHLRHLNKLGSESILGGLEPLTFLLSCHLQLKRTCMDRQDSKQLR